MDQELPRAEIVGAPRPWTAVVAVAIIAIAVTLVWKMIASERDAADDQLMSAASAATRSTE